MTGRRIKTLFDAAAGASAVGLLGAMKRLRRKPTAKFAGLVMRKVGPLFKEHRLGRENLRAAFPEKSDVEIEQILAGVWDNLGRIAVEFAHLDEFCVEGVGRQSLDVITYAPETTERYRRMLDRGEPMLGFAAHLANWELPAVVANVVVGFVRRALSAAEYPVAVGDVVDPLRAPLMGELVSTGLDAPVRLARLLQSGTHVGMLVDQHFTKGVEVTFFGRRCLANPLIALLARQTESPIHGLRAVRKPDGNSFWVDITDPVEPARDADGRIDIKGTMQAITAVVEGWVREHPEQWLWLHHRWR